MFVCLRFLLKHHFETFTFIQDEQRDALIHMNGFRGMGDRPIKVSMAIPKNKLGKDDEVGKKGGGGQYSYYYEAYWADRAAWTNYATYQQGGRQAIEYQNTMATTGGGLFFKNNIFIKAIFGNGPWVRFTLNKKLGI